jgi:hypothetical protein
MTAIHRLMSPVVAASVLSIGVLTPETALRAGEPSEMYSPASLPDRPSILTSGPRGIAPAAHARSSRDDDATLSALPHIRVGDDRLGPLLEYGRRHSLLLQAQIDRLEDSDVVVFLRCDPRLPAGASGRLSFVGKSAGIRYVLVRVGYVGNRLRQIALIGHELRHAVEVADTPAIVDTASLQQEYAQLGWVNRRASKGGVIAFETDQAVRAGEHILRELQNGTE